MEPLPLALLIVGILILLSGAYFATQPIASMTRRSRILFALVETICGAALIVAALILHFNTGA